MIQVLSQLLSMPAVRAPLYQLSNYCIFQARQDWICRDPCPLLQAKCPKFVAATEVVWFCAPILQLTSVCLKAGEDRQPDTPALSSHPKQALPWLPGPYPECPGNSHSWGSRIRALNPEALLCQWETQSCPVCRGIPWLFSPQNQALGTPGSSRPLG